MPKKKKQDKPGGPTKFKPEYCQGIIDFFSEAPNYIKEIVTEGKNGKGGEWKKTEYKVFANKWPTMMRYAQNIKVHVDTMIEWAKKENDHKYRGLVADEEIPFSEAYARAKQLYKEFICDNALVGVYNPIFAKFVLINTTDMKDVQVIDPGKGGSVVLKGKIDSLTQEQLNKTLTDFFSGKPVKGKK